LLLPIYLNLYIIVYVNHCALIITNLMNILHPCKHLYCDVLWDEKTAIYLLIYKRCFKSLKLALYFRNNYCIWANLVLNISLLVIKFFFRRFCKITLFDSLNEIFPPKFVFFFRFDVNAIFYTYLVSATIMISIRKPSDFSDFRHLLFVIKPEIRFHQLKKKVSLYFYSYEKKSQ